MRTRGYFVFLLAALVNLTASAMERPFPPEVKRGKMSPAAHPAIIINGKTRTLSAGSRIWNDNNLIELPASLRGEKHIVNYTETADGEIDRIWMLTAEEARQSIKTQQGK
jgi:hypothetical protein